MTLATYSSMPQKEATRRLFTSFHCVIAWAYPDIKTGQVFSAAVESLENSCALREGRRTRLVEGAAGLHELAGGQRFATALRHAAAADTFVAEVRAQILQSESTYSYNLKL
jgi:hypothetical protein